MSELGPYRSAIDPAWIDYNGHLNDACYGLILTKAVDHLLDFVGLDANYRARTLCTMYTLESHINYLNEVKSTDEALVQPFLLDFDKKKVQIGLRMQCTRLTAPAATMDTLLLHVHQGEKPTTAPFPADVVARMAALALAQGDLSDFAPRSRHIELTRR